MSKKAWIVSINMGYGHQRTAYPLKFLAKNNEIICEIGRASCRERV